MNRASMVATRAPAAAAFCRAFAVAAGLGLLVACEAGRETTLARSARQRQVGAERAEKQRLERERELLRLSNAETAAALAAARTDGVKAAAELRAHLVALRAELDRLQRGEQDLAAARARAAEVEAQIAPLREQEKLHAAAAQRLAALTAEVEAANKRVAEQEAELLPRLQAMQARLLTLQQLRQALDEAAKALAPPAAPPAAAEPKK